MTVCIALSCRRHPKNKPSERVVILCTDRLIGGSLGKAENHGKTRNISRGWYCLTSGEEAEINSFIEVLRNSFHGKKSDDLDDTRVQQLIRKALLDRKREKIEELVQGQFGMAYDEFIKGSDKFPPEIMRDTMDEIRKMKIDAECIVVGFDGAGYPLIVTTEQTGNTRLFEKFAVVGEGAYLAQSVLMHRQHTQNSDFSEALYTAYEAKKYSEGVPSVGASTSIYILTKGQKNRLLLGAKIHQRLETTYKRIGPQPIPALDFENDAFQDGDDD